MITIKNLKDTKTKIVHSKTRGGKELPSSSALDSPSILSRLASPPPTIHSDMSQVIDDTNFSINETCNDASTLLDKTVALGEFLDEQIAKSKEFENVETNENYESPDIPSSPTRFEMPKVPNGYVMDVEIVETFLLVVIEKILLNY